MFKKAFFLTLMIGYFPPSLPFLVAQENTLTLQQAFQKSLNQSESLATREEDIHIAEAHRWQALGTVLPQVNAKGTEFLQDTSSNASDGSTLSSSFTRRSKPEVSLGVSQTLFQGLREFRALKMAGVEKQKNIFEKQRATQILFSEVTRAYYTVIELEKELQILESIHSTMQKRINELNERLRLGKSRESEKLTVETQLATLEAQVEKIKGEIGSAREMLAFLIGEPVTQKLVDTFEVPTTIEPLNTLLAKLSSRPDLNASKEAVRLAEGKVNYQKGGYLPTLLFNGNYYPYRVGFQQDIKWDALFTLNFPLFSGGTTMGLVKEAKAGFKQSQLADEEKIRRAERDLRQTYNNFQTSLRREASLKKAEAKSAANFRAQSQEYRLGLVNNLEVLQSLRDWQERRLDDNRGHYQTKLDYLQLRVAEGSLP